MEYKNIFDYYNTLISMANAHIPSEKASDRLTKKEIKFLVHCCVYKFNGNSLESFTGMANNLINKAGFKNKREVSVYKTKLATKKWIKGSRDTFVLNNLFLNPREPKSFVINYVGT